MRKLLMADPEFASGTEHIAHVPVSNPTSKAWTYTAELYLVKDGKYTSSGIVTFTLAAGASNTIDFPITAPDIEGTYKVYLDVYVAEELIAAYIATEDVVIITALAGILEHDPFGFIWYEGLAGWEWVHTGREIPLNSEIHLAPGWINQSEVNIVGHIDLSVTYPDGTTVALSAAPDSAQDQEAAPGNGYHVGFEPFISSQAGTYTITATLSSAGQVLDSVTFTLEAIVEGFTYSGLFCDTERVGVGIAHLIYRATITNPGGVTQSRHVRLKFYSHEYYQTYEGVDSFDLSLGPFESHDYDYQRDFEGLEWQIQDMRSGTVYDVWMEDDGGGKSDVISITAK